MATETNTDTFTGVEGIVSYDGNPIAYVSFEMEMKRDTVAIPRGGKWSDISKPGKAKFSGKIKYGLVDPDLFIDAFDDGTNTTTASEETLHAAIAGNGAEQLVTTAITPPSVPMHIKLKIISTDGYTGDAVRIEGTDANDDFISETIPFVTQASGATTAYCYGHQVFKTVTGIRLPTALTANDNVTVYGAGQKTVTLGKPKAVTIYGKVMRGSEYVQITLTNCYLMSMPLKLETASDPVLPEQEFIVLDPDSDVTITTESA